MFLPPLHIVACEDIISICSQNTYLQNQTHEGLARDADWPIRLLLALSPLQEVSIQRTCPGCSEGQSEPWHDIEDAGRVVDCWCLLTYSASKQWCRMPYSLTPSSVTPTHFSVCRLGTGMASFWSKQKSSN